MFYLITMNLNDCASLIVNSDIIDDGDDGGHKPMDISDDDSLEIQDTHTLDVQTFQFLKKTTIPIFDEETDFTNEDPPEIINKRKIVRARRRNAHIKTINQLAQKNCLDGRESLMHKWMQQANK